MLQIKYELDKRHMKQVTLAQTTGIHEASISRIVNGKEEAYSGRAKRIADALDWEGDPAELFRDLEVK